MPLNNAVLDFHPLGIVDTPSGPRQRVVLVAAQRDMVERLLNAVRAANLSPEGVDLSAFALIRSLFRPDDDRDGRVLYLNVDGLTNLAIAEGKMCRFTRVVGAGLEGLAGELAVRLGVPVASAHELLAAVDLDAEPPSAPTPAPEAATEAAPAEHMIGEAKPEPADPAAHPESAEEHEARERAMSYQQMTALPASGAPPASSAAPASAESVLAREVLENGIREISGEVRNSLDFHRSQEGGGEVSHVVLSGAAQDIPGFARSLQASLGVEVRGESIDISEERLGGVSPHRLAVATGLAVTEAPQ